MPLLDVAARTAYPSTARPPRRAGRRRDSSSASARPPEQHLLGLARARRPAPARSESRASPRPCRAARAGSRRDARADSDRCRRATGSSRCADERIVEPEQILVAQLHDRGRGERLRDRADPVLVVRCHPLAGAASATPTASARRSPRRGRAPRPSRRAGRPAPHGAGVRAPGRDRSSSGRAGTPRSAPRRPAGRVNSAGGSSPFASISRTFVPDRKTWSSPE